jgi:hypothetical protein
MKFRKMPGEHRNSDDYICTIKVIDQNRMLRSIFEKIQLRTPPMYATKFVHTVCTELETE